MIIEEVHVRPAEDSDTLFLRELFFTIRAPEFEAAGLVGEPLRMLLAQQYQAMRSHYDNVYAGALYEIFELDGQPVGYQAWIELDTLHLIDISLEPEFRGQGLGTHLMLLMQDKAKSLGKPMTLTVEKFNPALRLYERLGFVMYQDSDVYQRMKWEPS